MVLYRRLIENQSPVFFTIAIQLYEGMDRIYQLNIKLSELHRTEDILKAATDKEYQKKLLKEFGLE